VGKLDPGGRLRLWRQGGAGIFEILFVFLFVDLFDNLGTLMAVTRRAGLIEPAGNIPGLNRMLVADRWRRWWARWRAPRPSPPMSKAPAAWRSADARA
jgi:hypothetical protein